MTDSFNVNTQARELAKSCGYAVTDDDQPTVIDDRRFLPPFARFVGNVGKFIVYVVATSALFVQIFLVPSGLIKIQDATNDQIPICRKLVEDVRTGAIDPNRWDPPVVYFRFPNDDEPPMRSAEFPFDNISVVSSSGAIPAFELGGLTPPFDPPA